MSCTVPDCVNPIDAAGLCGKHRARLRRHGDLHTVLPRSKPHPVLERLEERTKRTPTCWLWTGSCTKAGYPRMSVDGREVYLHRFVYELAYGPIPEGIEVCHTCDVPPCIRPEHLFLGTQADNMRDMARKGRWRNQHS